MDGTEPRRTGATILPTDINHASTRDLAAITGIGDARARQIVEWRKRRGPFETIDDLQYLPLFDPCDVAALRGKIKAGRA